MAATIILLGAFLTAFGLGSLILVSAKTVFQEVEAGILFICASVFLTGTMIAKALQGLQKSLGIITHDFKTRQALQNDGQ